MPYLLGTLVVLALLLTQALIGGAKLLYSIPGYTILAVAALFSVGRLLRERRGPDAICVLTTLCFCGYLIYRAAVSPVEYLARPDLYLVLGCLCIYSLAANHLTSSKQRIFILGVLFVFAFAQLIVGVIQFKDGKQYMPIPWLVRVGYGSRASGLYICPNHLAGLLEVLGLMALSISVWSRCTVVSKILLAYTAVGCFLGVAISGSRGGYLSSAAGLLFFAINSVLALKRLAPGKALKLGPVIVAGTLLFIAGSVTLMNKSHLLRSRVESIAETNNGRLLLWEAALKQFVQNPVWGTGAGTYLYYGRHFRSAMVQNDPIYVHNDYLHLLAEYGIAGSLFFLVFLLAHLNRARHSLRWLANEHLKSRGILSSHTLALQLGAFSVLVAYIVHSVLDFNAHIPANALLLALLFGMIANPGVEGLQLPWPRIATWTGIVAPVTGLVILLAATPKLFGEYYAELARIGVRDNKPQEALEGASAGLIFEKANPDIFYYLGESHRLLAETDNREFHSAMALDAFRKGLTLFPWDLRSLLKCGRTLDELRRFPEAKNYLLRAIDADPNFTNVYAYYGLHFHRQGNLDQAEIHYQKALSLSANPLAKIGMEEIAQERQRHGLPAGQPQ